MLMMGEGGTAPTVDLSLLMESIDRFAARPVRPGHPSVIGDELIVLRQAVDTLELEFSVLAARFASTSEYRREGSTSPIDWLKSNTHISGAAACDRIAVGEQLDKLPKSSSAMIDGQIGFGHLAVMAHTATAMSESPTAQPFREDAILKRAVDVSIAQLRTFCRHYRHAGDPEGFSKEQVSTVEQRRLEFSGPDEGGMVWLNGVFDAEGGAVIRTALEPLARRDGTLDGRCRDRRLADALVELAGHALDSGSLPDRASQRAHLQITAPVETVLGLPGSPAADMEFALPISGDSVRRISCDCNVTRILLGPESAVVDVGRSRRVVSGSTRRALNVRDGGCRWPGCDRQASWTAAHHVVHWSQGGPTDLSNLVLLCYRHHFLVHEGGWQLIRTDQGEVLTVPPRVEIDPFARGPAD